MNYGNRPPGIVQPEEKKRQAEAAQRAAEIAKQAEAARAENARQEQIRQEYMRQQQHLRQQEQRRQEEYARQEENRRQEEHTRRQEDRRQQELKREREHNRQQELNRRDEERRAEAAQAAEQARQSAKQGELRVAKEKMREQEKRLKEAKVEAAAKRLVEAQAAKQKEEAVAKAAAARQKSKDTKTAAAAAAAAKALAIKEAKAKIAEAEAAAAARPGKRKLAAPPGSPGAASAATLFDEDSEVWTKQPDIECTEIITVTQGSPESVWASMIKKVKTATFVAVDCEFSGIGPFDNKKNPMRQKDIETRYIGLRTQVQNHGLLQVGLSIWTTVSKGRYFVTSYCIPVLPEEDFLVTPCSMQFLAEAGIDLSQLFLDGVRYKKPKRDVSKGAASANADSKLGERKLRELMAACYSKPFITHNGLLDLMFLFEAFTAPLPKSLNNFVKEAVKLYRGQLLDTKCIAEYSQSPSWSPSYLQLLYARARRLCGTAAVDEPAREHLQFLSKKSKKASNTTPRAAEAEAAAEDGVQGDSKRRRILEEEDGAGPVASEAPAGAAAAGALVDGAAAQGGEGGDQQLCQICPNYACVMRRRRKQQPNRVLHDTNAVL